MTIADAEGPGVLSMQGIAARLQVARRYPAELPAAWRDRLLPVGRTL